MNNSLATSFTGPSKPKHTPSVNPFARALASTAELEKPSSTPSPDTPTSLFSKALANTGGGIPGLADQAGEASNGDYANSGEFGFQDGTNDGTLFDQSAYQQQQADEQARQAEEQAQQQREQQKRDQLRLKLHNEVNPTETSHVFSAREREVKYQIEQLRQELLALIKDVHSFQAEVETTLHTQIVSPGQEGKYYLAFFQQLRSFILLLRQKVSSAKTWATQMHSKGKKKSSAPGLSIGGQGHEKTSTVQDMMHHERSTAYSAG